MAGSFGGAGGRSCFKEVGGALKQIQVSLRHVRHLPDDDVAALGFAQRRFHL